MNKYKKNRTRTVALILSLSIIGQPTVALAHTNQDLNSRTKVEFNKILHTKQYVICQLYKLGFTDEEVKELFKKFPYDSNEPLLQFRSNNIDKGNTGLEMNSPIMLRTSPGETRNETYYISTAWVKGLGHSVTIGGAGLGLSASQWAKIIVKKVGWKVSLLVGAIASAVGDMFMGPNGVRIDMTYTWTYGDNSMTWYWAPTRFNVTKY